MAAEQQLVPLLVQLVDAGRRNGVRVIHCTAAFRADGAGSYANSPLLASAMKHRGRLLVGSPEAEPVLELASHDADLTSVRLHGVGPFIGTSLDPILRSLGVKTIVLIGGSVNVGILAACTSAIDLGYRVVIPRDGVVGTPADYVDAVFVHTLALLARITTVAELVAVWSP